jgi:signal transduction histidine kinase/predicted CoA-binding protein
MYNFLKKVALFADMPDDDLARLCELIDEVHLEPGEQLFAEGSPGDKAYVIKEGEVEIIKTASGRQVLLAVRHPGEVIGEISLIEEAPRMASVRARSKSVLLEVGQEQFETLLDHSPSAVRATLYNVISRWRSTQAKLRQSEKMAQLGTLSAGLAHELNNPAAAVQRSTEQLRQVDEQIQKAQIELTSQGLSREQIDRLLELGAHARQVARKPDELAPLARSDREEALEDWLEAQGYGELWEIVPPMVSLGYGPEELKELIDYFTKEKFPAAMTWLAGSFTFSSLMGEVHEGASRISGIVKALKSYAYLDQAPVQSVDIHEGLDDTLVLLRNTLKAGIHLKREYAEVMPRIQGYGSELNQVWTNLIDNAVDAMQGKGELVVRTHWDGDWVVVEIQDDGPGIPENHLDRIFEPFFTTKPPGKGTGLGLDISYNIIVNKHRGDIQAHSRPGKTVFEVRLPVNFERQGESAPLVQGVRRLSDDRLRELLGSVRKIAVVGISSQEHLPAYSVPAYLHAHGYKIFPVNPNITEILGERSYADLKQIPEPIDVVMIFRRIEEVPEIVDQAIEMGARVIWMQEGIMHEQAAQTAREAGLEVVMDTCMRTTHRRLMGEGDRKKGLRP